MLLQLKNNNMIHWNVEQKSNEWHALRWGRVGGTSSTMLYKESDALYDKLFSENAEGYNELEEEGFQNSHMQRGNELEPIARIELCNITGLDFKDCGIILYGNMLSYSPDGLTECERFGTEIKCPDTKSHHRMVRLNEVAVEYHGQIGAFFSANPKLEVLYFMSYRPESDICTAFVKEFKRDSYINMGTEKTPKMIKISSYCDKLKIVDELWSLKIKNDINKSLTSF